ncbi:hypothetical protein N752_16565 [Desulforamulus aquiferis]|nr:S-layer homology domain-containing protein [Desulforamulus aquiferis]RYD04002.1 hypothetical protein N752_16565 [Desulforamulus aquiferis]
MKNKLVAILLVLFLIAPSLSFANTPFTDTTEHWASKDIELAFQHGLLKGVGEDRFNPEGTLTRAELAVCLDRIFDFNFSAMLFLKEPVLTDYFDDVQESEWYSQSILESAVFNIFDIQDRKFKPGEPVTRLEVAEAIAKSFEAKSLSVATILLWPHFKDIETTNTLAFIHNTGI